MKEKPPIHVSWFQPSALLLIWSAPVSALGLWALFSIAKATDANLGAAKVLDVFFMITWANVGIAWALELFYAINGKYLVDAIRRERWGRPEIKKAFWAGVVVIPPSLGLFYYYQYVYYFRAVDYVNFTFVWRLAIVHSATAFSMVAFSLIIIEGLRWWRGNVLMKGKD